MVGQRRWTQNEITRLTRAAVRGAEEAGQVVRAINVEWGPVGPSVSISTYDAAALERVEALRGGKAPSEQKRIMTQAEVTRAVRALIRTVQDVGLPISSVESTFNSVALNVRISTNQPDNGDEGLRDADLHERLERAESHRRYLKAIGLKPAPRRGPKHQKEVDRLLKMTPEEIVRETRKGGPVDNPKGDKRDQPDD